MTRRIMPLRRRRRGAVATLVEKAGIFGLRKNLRKDLNLAFNLFSQKDEQRSKREWTQQRADEHDRGHEFGIQIVFCGKNRCTYHAWHGSLSYACLTGEVL